MLKITKLAEDSSQLILKLEGRIVSEWVPLLENECMGYRTQKKDVLLDCSDVTYVDKIGVEMLRRVVTDDITIVGCSALVKLLLKK